MSKVTVTFTVPDAEQASEAVMAVEDALPEWADELEWDVDE